MLADTDSPSCSDYLAGSDHHYTNKIDARISYIGCNHCRLTTPEQLSFHNRLNVVAVNASAQEISVCHDHMQKRLNNY